METSLQTVKTIDKGTTAPSTTASAVSVSSIPSPQKSPLIDPAVLQKSQELSESIDRINQVLKDGGRDLNFSLDNSLETPVIQVKNATTGQVVRQIPTEVVVNIAHNIDAFKGVLLNEFS